jgi:hypothetical protein
MTTTSGILRRSTPCQTRWKPGQFADRGAESRQTAPTDPPDRPNIARPIIDRTVFSPPRQGQADRKSAVAERLSRWVRSSAALHAQSPSPPGSSGVHGGFVCRPRRWATPPRLQKNLRKCGTRPRIQPKPAAGRGGFVCRPRRRNGFVWRHRVTTPGLRNGFVRPGRVVAIERHSPEQRSSRRYDRGEFILHRPLREPTDRSALGPSARAISHG